MKGLERDPISSGLTEPQAILRNAVDHAASVIDQGSDPRYSSRGTIYAVHGYAQWGIGPFRPLRDRLQRDRIRLDPISYNFLRDIEESTHEVAEQIKAKQPEGELDLLGHSMGALIVDGLTKLPGIGERVRTAIYLSCPYDGTYVAWLGIMTPSGRQLLPGSKFLRDLKSRQSLNGTRKINLYGEGDWIVPAKSSGSTDAPDSLELEGIGHAGILYNELVYEKIRNAILRSE